MEPPATCPECAGTDFVIVTDTDGERTVRCLTAGCGWISEPEAAAAQEPSA